VDFTDFTCMVSRHVIVNFLTSLRITKRRTSDLQNLRMGALHLGATDVCSVLILCGPVIVSKVETAASRFNNNPIAALGYLPAQRRASRLPPLSLPSRIPIHRGTSITWPRVRLTPRFRKIFSPKARQKSHTKSHPHRPEYNRPTICAARRRKNASRE